MRRCCLLQEAEKDLSTGETAVHGGSARCHRPDPAGGIPAAGAASPRRSPNSIPCGAGQERRAAARLWPVPRNAVDGVRNQHRNRVHQPHRSAPTSRSAEHPGPEGRVRRHPATGWSGDRRQSRRSGPGDRAVAGPSTPRTCSTFRIGPPPKLTAGRRAVIETCPAWQGLLRSPRHLCHLVTRHKPNPHRLHTQFENVLNWTAKDSPYREVTWRSCPSFSRFGTLLLMRGGSPIATILGRPSTR